MKTPKTSKPRKTAVRCTGWVAELEAVIGNVKSLSRRTKLDDDMVRFYLTYAIKELNGALKAKRGRSATVRMSDGGRET